MSKGPIRSKLLYKRLYNLTLKFLVPLTLEETYPIVGGVAMKLLGTQYASIFIKRGRKFERVWDSSPKMFRVESDKRKYAAHAVISRVPSVVGASKLAPLHPSISDWGIKSVVFIPLFYRNSRMGYIALDSLKPIKLTPEEIDRLKIFGSMAMMAIRKAQLLSEVKESLETRDLFISLASHELRSPLTTINSYSQLIEKTLSLGKKPEHKWSKILRDETTRMIHMVNELLQLNTIKSGKLQYAWRICSLNDILRRAVVNFKVRYENRRLIYKNALGGEKANVLADFDKVLQVVLNVLNNAAKFSDAEIIMTLSKLKSNYCISIADRGEGIEEKDKTKVFEGFYKGKHSTKAGIGLGLYLAKNVVEMHRGKIKVESEKGQGTEVCILLPKVKENSTT